MGFPYKCKKGHDITNVSQVYEVQGKLYHNTCDTKVLEASSKDDLAKKRDHFKDLKD